MLTKSQTNQTKSLKEFKRDHKLFFKNKPAGETHNVHKGFLITTAYEQYQQKSVTKVWSEKEVGVLVVLGYFTSVKDAKDWINEYE